MRTRPLRIGSVPYLNACVLVHGLEDRDGISLTFGPPSVLARDLESGRLDVALASSIEHLRHPEYLVVPGLSISGLDEMWSIRLFHRVPLPDVRKVALDPASETTNALLQVLLDARADTRPQYVMRGTPSRAPGSEPVVNVDAFLLIGDSGLTFRDPAWEAWDLQSAWHTLTGLPFVYGLWLARPGVDIEHLGPILRRCRDDGLRDAWRIAEQAAGSRGLTPERAHEYITRVVRYSLGAEEEAGLRRFREFLVESRLLSVVPTGREADLTTGRNAPLNS